MKTRFRPCSLDQILLLPGDRQHWPTSGPPSITKRVGDAQGLVKDLGQHLLEFVAIHITVLHERIPEGNLLQFGLGRRLWSLGPPRLGQALHPIARTFQRLPTVALARRHVGVVWHLGARDQTVAIQPVVDASVVVGGYRAGARLEIALA